MIENLLNYKKRNENNNNYYKNNKSVFEWIIVKQKKIICNTWRNLKRNVIT